MAMQRPAICSGSGQIVADLSESMLRHLHSRLDDGENLAFGDHVINADEYQFEFARCR
jgi:hypothetical protein